MKYSIKASEDKIIIGNLMQHVKDGKDKEDKFSRLCETQAFINYLYYTNKISFCMKEYVITKLLSVYIESVS